jgi:solute carrier family 25 protein 38
MRSHDPLDDRKWLKDLAAGAVAGSVCGTIFQPLDVIKTNLIILPSDYIPENKSSTRVLADVVSIIYRREGLSGFWMGSTPAVLRTSTSCAIYFSLLRLFDKHWKKNLGDNGKVLSDFLDSGLARVTTSLITNPLNMLKTQWTLLGEKQPNRNFIGAFSQLLRNDRSKVFMIGTLPMIIEEFMYGGIFNAIYEYLNRKIHVGARVHPYLIMFANGIIAGAVGAVLTHPLEIARTKIQSNKKHWHPANGKNLMLAAFVYTYRKYGWVGFTRGFLPRFLKKTLMAASSFSLYELIRKRKLAK